MAKLIGYAAIEFAREHGCRLDKYTDPIEGARRGLTVEQAEEIAKDDPSLIYVSAYEYEQVTDTSGT